MESVIESMKSAILHPLNITAAKMKGNIICRHYIIDRHFEIVG